MTVSAGSTFSGERQPPAELVATLARALDAGGISYCHWKSNEAIDRSESALNDLDLLVERRHADAFRSILHRMGFKRLDRSGKPRPPGKEDFVGYDEGTDRFVHVDAHYQLVVGHDRTKNHRLPIERPYLESARHGGLLRIPSAEFEYVVFVMRMVLKYAIWDEVLWETVRGREVGLTATERRELVHLEAAIDGDVLTSILADHLAWLDRRLFDACAHVVHGNISLTRRLSIGRELHAALGAFARRGALVDGGLRLWRRLELGAQTRTGRRPRFRFPGGGAMVGILGGDGSGKSTAVGEIVRWLEADFDVRRIHLGKPHWSATTYGVRGTLKIAAVLGSKLPGGSRRAGQPMEPDGSHRSMLWLACAARDRYRCYRKARRFVNRGGLVISDRYPHRALTSMDVAQIARMTEDIDIGALGATLTHVEERYHDRIAEPELLVVLHVDPDTAARRKTDEPDDYVRRRVAELGDIDWESWSVRVIDARQTKDAVAAELKSLIWSSL